MNIKKLVLGDFQTNSYIVSLSAQAKDCLLIDMGMPDDSLIKYLKENHLNPVSVILTHGHIDHIAIKEDVKTNYPNASFYIHNMDSNMLTDPSLNLSILSMNHFKTEPADFLVEHGDIIEAAGLNFKVIHTPGHTPGGMCLYNETEKILFSGDSLFAESIGRTDFPGCSHQQLLHSIKEKLMTLPPETIVYPGHGPATTIEHEIKYNPFLQ